MNDEKDVGNDKGFSATLRWFGGSWVGLVEAQRGGEWR